MDSLGSRPPRIYLSPPHLGKREAELVSDAIASNWIAPLGPNVDAFEGEFCDAVGCEHALALSSGTAAIHLALVAARVKPRDEVFVSTFTFAGGVFPISYVGGIPVFIDSDKSSWNMDPGLLEEALTSRSRSGRLPGAVIVAHLYGQSADLDRIVSACARFGVPLIEDAAEALGASYKGRAPGTLGLFGAFSFNGNKIITTSGGGMLVSRDPHLIRHARMLASQAREPVPHYEHAQIGYNYRMSNILAALGRGQLESLEERVAARRRVHAFYRAALGDLEGVEFMPEAPWGRHTRWLTTILVDAKRSGVTRVRLCEALEAANIEARPLWKPMHMQPLFRDSAVFGGSTSEELFEKGMCLPSGSSLSTEDLERVAATIRSCFTA